MKIRIILWLIFIALYLSFHFGFREIGGNRLYLINDSIAFELLATPNSFDDVTIRGYRRTNPLIRFMCGACEVVNYGEVDMLRANYIKGDFVYSAFPQYDSFKTDIVNLRTGETLNVDVANNDEGLIDLQTIPEYRERGLVAGEQYRLKPDYVKANFEPLSTYTGWCIRIHIGFGILALFIIFPRFALFVLEMTASAFDPNNPTNYLNPK